MSNGNRNEGQENVGTKVHDFISVFDAKEIWIDPGPPRIFAPPNPTTYAVMLGSGKPEPTPYRFGPGGAVIVTETPYLIDAGEGIWRGMAMFFSQSCTVVALLADFLRVGSYRKNKENRRF